MVLPCEEAFFHVLFTPTLGIILNVLIPLFLFMVITRLLRHKKRKGKEKSILYFFLASKWWWERGGRGIPHPQSTLCCWPYSNSFILEIVYKITGNSCCWSRLFTLFIQTRKRYSTYFDKTSMLTGRQFVTKFIFHFFIRIQQPIIKALDIIAFWSTIFQTNNSNMFPVSCTKTAW